MSVFKCASTSQVSPGGFAQAGRKCLACWGQRRGLLAPERMAVCLQPVSVGGEGPKQRKEPG